MGGSFKKVQRYTEREEPRGRFLLWQHITISYKTRKIWISLLSFIRMHFFQGET